MSDHGQATHERVRRPLQAELRRSPDHQHWPTADTHAGGRTALDRFRAYFWSDNARRTQTLLGLVWLLDGGLQFQGFMYSHGFSQLLASGAAGQPGWLHDSIIWGAKFANDDLTIWNTLFALTQVLLGLGLLYRPLVKPALLASFGWVLVVWWFGEAFGMLFANKAQPLTGAPGGVLMYALIGLVAWPSVRPGGLLGIRGAKTMWAALWLMMAWLWLLAPNSSANATHDALSATDSGIGWLNSVQTHLASAAQGDGLVIALVLAAVSAAIGISVAADWRPRAFLTLAIALNVVYWIVPQGLGGIFAGGATDPNAAPLFVLLAHAMYPIVTDRRTRIELPHAASAVRDTPASVRPASVRPASRPRDPDGAASRRMLTMFVPSGLALTLLAVAIATGAAWLIVLVILAGPIGTATWIARLALTSDPKADAPAVISRRLRLAGLVEATFDHLDARLLELFRRAPVRSPREPVGGVEHALDRIARHPLRLSPAPIRLGPKTERARSLERSGARESYDTSDAAPTDPAQPPITHQTTSTTP